jgi:glycine oxidase
VKVVVIGAGVVGCATAYELARRGARVHIVDGRGPGLGASRASAGVLAPHIEGHSDALLALGLRSLEMYDAFVERVSRDGNVPVEYERCGTLEVALDEEQAKRLRSFAERAAGGRMEFVDGSDARRLEPLLGERVTGAILTPTDGYVKVRDLMTALVAATAAHGVEFSSVHVTGIEPTSSGVRLVADASVLDADAVVIAAGSWSGRPWLHAVPTAPVKPVRGQLLELACDTRPAGRVIWGADCYLVPWRDNTLLVGATVEDVGFDESATVAGVSGLVEAAREVIPSVQGSRFKEVRVGLRPATPDLLPIVGRSALIPGAYYVTGHYRSGVLLAPWTAAAAAEDLLERRPAPGLETTRPSRFGL